MSRSALWLLSLSTVFALLLVLCCGNEYDYEFDYATSTPDYYDNGTIDYDQYVFVYQGNEDIRSVSASNEVPHLLPLILGLAALQLCQML